MAIWTVTDISMLRRRSAPEIKNSPTCDKPGTDLNHDRSHTTCPRVEVGVAKDLVDRRTVLNAPGAAAHRNIPAAAHRVLDVVHAESNIIVTALEF